MCPRYGSEKYCRRTNSTICRRLKMYRYILVYFSFFCSNFENKVLAKLPQNRPRDTYTIPENGRTVRVHRSIVSGQKSVSTEKKKALQDIDDFCSLFYCYRRGLLQCAVHRLHLRFIRYRLPEEETVRQGPAPALRHRTMIRE